MRAYKKLQDNLLADVDRAVEIIAANHDRGDRKKGDLSELYLYKFRSQSQLYLLGYTRDEELRLIFFETIGLHENHYQDLKN